MATCVRAQSPAITITGADDALADNIRQHLRIGGETCDTPLSRLERLQSQVLGNLQRAANALGYYRSTARATFSQEADCWHLALEVTPGERIPVTEVSIHLPDNRDIQEIFQDVLADTPDLQGRPLNHGDYESIKSALSAAAVENGYFGAQFLEAEIRIDLAAYEAAIVIDFEPGPRYRFGEIRVLPVDGFADAFLERMITLQTGQPYSSSALLQQRRQLDNTQYFRQISITPQLARADNQSVPVIIELSPRPRRAYTGGIGFTTDTGPRLRVAYENRYVNRRGHHLEGDAAASTVRSQINLGYTIPINDPLTTNLQIKTGYITEDTDSYSSNRYKLESAFNRESDAGWLESYSVDYLRDDYVLPGEDPASSSLTMLGYSLSKRAGDDFINPTKGWRLYGQVRGASDAVLSNTSFLQFYTSGKGIISIGNGRFITRFEAGTTLINNASDLPASVRFFAGGDRSLRGYDFKSIGPVNDSGEVVGGKHLLVGSLEYDHLVKNNVRAAVFYDAGNAFSTHKFDFKHSVGVGVRWLSPIGPIRADLAHPLEGGGGVRLHITMGPDL